LTCRVAVDDINLVQWFLGHGADPNARCLLDLTPTSYAVSLGSIEVFDLLLERGADIHKGQLLHHAVHRDFDDAEDIIIKLLDLGCPINEVKFQNDSESWEERQSFGLGTALHRAAEFRSASMVRLLLERGADTRVLDSRGMTALYWAKKRSGREAIVKLLEEWDSRSQNTDIIDKCKVTNHS
jgi:ankyrin repeat protein